MKNPRHAIASVALAATLALGGCAAPAGQSGQASNQQSSSTQQEASLASWNDDSPTIKLVKDYVKNVTDEKSADFIPKEDRVVTIDWDGTLYGELDPIYLDWAMYVHRVLWDSTYTPTPEQVEVARQVEEVERTRKFPSGLEAQHAKCLAEVFGGMSVSDFKAYVAEFAETDAPKFKNLKRKDAYFKPMVELVKYLEANDFDCYIVSGTDRNVLQVLLKDYFPEIKPDHIKGSVSTVVASGQGDKDGLDYTWNKTDVPTLGGQLVIKDVKANKPTIIATEIGKQPVISLGNSSGDSSMANYVVNNNKYKSLALMLMCDDTTRDWGELDKAQSMKESCEKNGWHAVSERDEWKTIFGDGVSLDEGWTWSSEQAGPNRSQSENPAAASMEQAA
ncbi:HAD family hydrolase [Olsenella intestinalis]|uniref:HAD family hydrolase n=1 Tax=Olsenella intestinalis TaxID=2930083 RepID=UPI00200BCEA9|nr:HAD family hydrolase [Olsenella intestinalis]